jgi:hypothetical protein
VNARVKAYPVLIHTTVDKAIVDAFIKFVDRVDADFNLNKAIDF